MDGIRSEPQGGWHRIVLDRPDRLNALDIPMHRALVAALDAAEADTRCRAVLLTGAGRGFCAGQDLTARAGGAAPDLGATLEAYYNPLIRRLRSLPMPVVCAVNGVAAGAGANIALACDIVLAARSARFIQAFARIGLVPDAGGTWILPRLIGDARARALMLLGDAIDAETAVAWGMIWRMVDDDALTPEAEALTARLATQPTQGFALTKQALLASPANGLDAQLDLERDLQRQAGQTPDYTEGVQAFLDKRAAVFTGAA